MATSGYQPINYSSPITGSLIQQLLGQQTSTSGTQNTQQTTAGSTTGTTSGSTNTTSSAELGPLLQAFSQASQGMTPEQLSSLVTSIFQEGAKQVPSLIGAYANATGSRASNNSAVSLAIDQLNKEMTTQAVQSLLNYNQGQSQTAANAAAQIANNTRSQQQTQQQSQNQNQNQVQTGSTNTQQTQQQTVSPKSTGLLAGGMGALSLLSKTGLLEKLGLGGKAGAAAGAAGGVGTITGGGSLAPTGGLSLTNGGGGAPASSGMFTAPSASSGFLANPAATANPYGGSSIIGGGGGMGSGAGAGVSAGLDASSLWPSGGITGMGGYSTPSGMLGTGADFGFGALSPSFNAFGTLGTDSLGSNLNFGSNPFDYGGSSSGITGIVNGAGGGGIGDFFNGAMANAASGISDFGGWLGGALGGVGDWIGSFFADGGQVGNRGFGAPGDTRYSGGVTPTGPVALPPMNIFDGTRMRQEMQAGLQPMPVQMQQGTNVQVPQGTPSMGVSPAAVMQLIPFLLQQATGIQGYVDGGQVQTGGSATRVRNQNYLGARPQEQRQEAINYSGYAPAAGGVGSTTSVATNLGASVPTASLMAAPAARAGGTTAQSQGDANAAAWKTYYDSLEKAAIMNQRGGGSGGVGEGASPGQNEADNGQAGIGPSGIAAAPTGTGQAVSMGLGQIGLGVPGLSSILSLMAMIASAVNAANQAAAGGANGGVSGASVGEGPTTATVSVGDVTDSATGANANANAPGIAGSVSSEGSGSVGGGGDGGVGGGSGTSAGGSTGGSSSGDGGNGGGNYADGGLVLGPGNGTSDSIPVKPRTPGGKSIRYSDGEYVIPQDVVQTLGVDHFDRLVAAFHTPSTMH